MQDTDKMLAALNKYCDNKTGKPLTFLMVLEKAASVENKLHEDIEKVVYSFGIRKTQPTFFRLAESLNIGEYNDKVVK
jgi:hypothetical protein